ncbi:protein SHORT ROOT IN SALT MEDIUM 1 isoform X1 [Lactuca sativa]|uniref:protein SHORT ROOT IN SALT MEDIUM 1 isoform X1 n=1 Tax=Lactuca sativa TaxID=4236 RepID=UPI000CD88E10|nr:protein SHORT ROOT IN SALT MEDIUM 1 isoform X1 [Lactuca sativa]XP_023769341.1 protein SHORT ROOT IN SALT MEDIUM 1 isoform X1 [Lactuca sativa]XP_023769347.1 protein SHORT ROOT IN SALT MEDIUM 1 isoform X1 [Lactuca sativa]XP_023769356.1 protein SHORT ROOT IN SALT MEDIUM 1 isoform X1 [Lactuca sativa]XP_023769362.1 protein SHORT ROOT IN SALT MEDIUM 1 isoform X1 [Lactuca sativa]XP_023769381.1 protein SHORT ROOT IN SALT MEDIUM 1 isoform X1 [Lactuca sativa]
MYPSRGNNAYGQQQQQQQQQSFSGQSAYGQNVGPDGGASQMSMASRHSAMLSGHPSSTGTHYGGQYASVYGGSVAISSALESLLQASGASASGASGDYSVLSQKYGQKEIPGYSPGDRSRAGVYSSRDLQNEPTARFGDSVAYGHHQNQGDIYSHLDAASALRKELLQTQTLQSSSIEGSSRQSDYLSRATTIRHTGQELSSYTGRMDDMSHHGQQHAPSILGAAPPQNIDNHVYTHTSASATSGYGVSLPPGRDYGSAKGLHSTPQGAMVARGGYARVDDRAQGQGQGHNREINRRAEDLHRDVLRDRERKRERERVLERREKERDRENKRVIEKKRERTPPRIEASSSLHRRRSPAKEKRRDYVCKVNSSSLVDFERDYLSIDKRYPRLFTSPECSKVIVNWSRENLKIPLNVPVSFEHDFVRDDTETQQKEASITTMVDDPVKSEHTRWNAKIVLMSGLSQNALEELSSERDYEDRIPHFCNMIRFACLKSGNTFKAIGGLWETTDGNDPSVDKSTLVHTAIRYAKDLTGLDLKNCQHWNPFLEIHYDRVKKDGIFSHKEVTVLYVPDLSDCLPSADAWRDQWLSHKKAIAEREHQHALKREIARGKKEGLKDKEPGTPKDLKKDAKLEKKKVSESDESASKLKEMVKDKVKEPENEGVHINSVDIEKKNVVETPGEGNNSVEKKTGSGKKKIIRKIIKKKVVKKDKAGDTTKQTDTLLDSKKAGETTTETEVAGQGQSQSQESTGNTPAVKTLTKKKVIKKVPVVKAVKKEDVGTQSEVVTPVKEKESSEIKPKSADIGSLTSVKKTVKKKIIKRVVKKKVVAKDKVADKPEVTIDEEQSVVPEQKKDEIENKGEKKGKMGSKTKGIIVQSDNNEKLETEEKLKEGKVKKEKDVKGETKGKEVKDNKKDEEVPRHPGLFLQTKESNKFRSSSLSLDSLLDYDDNDVEESTFELSLFAETFYEMLQYQMGSRILAFLQKLRIKFVAKRNQKKRQLEEVSEKEKVKTSKRLKSDDSEVKIKSVENEILEKDEKNIPKVENMVTENIENTKSDEDLEEDEDMTDASSKDNTSNEKIDIDLKSKNIVKNEEEEEEKVDLKKKEIIDKELLQAFRFFDRNRVGHIRVEDMRLIIHNLGNFLSHREVKELVQSALLESNTGRDDRILYNKLVKMTDI